MGEGFGEYGIGRAVLLVIDRNAVDQQAGGGQSPCDVAARVNPVDVQ